ncbi:MAG: DUF3455 domain-containing protein [Bacteroidetes bacterium]|nr:MAG: DUF3455 domain-containing protein [Bacteroidota bacterium]
MQKTIRKNISGLMWIASLALVITSCQKEKSAPLQTASDALSHSSHATMTPELCSPIPDSLQVPEGNRLFLQTFARGVQIYEVQRSAANPNTLVWVNIASLAELYVKPDFVDHIIHHFAGPSWQFIKGPFKDEKVVAKKVKGSTQDPTAIQWLLLQAVDDLSTPGNPVSFVQRICTHGGLAPTTAPTQLGALDSIPYTASYLFYTRN